MTKDLYMMRKVTRLGDLFDVYGALLTERQREMMELHYLDDWSLGEISTNLEVSRQAVHDHIKRAEEQLEGYEAVLHLLERAERKRQLLDALSESLKHISPRVSADEWSGIQDKLDALAADPL